MELHLKWASETGHALDLLRQFADQCRTRCISITSVSPLETGTTFTKGIYILFVSTTGQGAPPYTMRPLWKDMMKKGFKIEEGVKFGIYSLGDRGYGDNFGMAARKLRQRLRMLGAEELIEVGLGDDQQSQGYRQIYLSGWAENILNTLKTITKEGQGKDIVVNLRNFQKQSKFELKSLKELSSRKGRKVLWVQFKVSGLQVKEGDVLQIFPFNREEEVEYLLKHFQKPDNYLVNFLGRQFPLKEVLSQYANVSSVLNYYFFSNSNYKNIIQSAQNELHRGKIKQFCQNYEEFHNFVVKYKRNVVEFLKDFEIKLDLQYFLKVIGQVVARKYSVARVKENRVWILVKVVQNQITQGRFYKGLCSHDFQKIGILRKGRVLKGDIVPEELKENNIIVTLGTGIAPFIWVIDRLSKGDSQALLVYTNSFSDEIFHRKVCSVQNLREVVSCTREGGQKLIRLIESHLQTISQFLLKGNSRVFYCGPKQIQDFLHRCIASILKISPEQLTKKKVIVCQNW